MKKASRFAALLAAVMLFGSVAAMPALAAEDVTSTPVPTATAEPTVTPAPTDNGQSAPNNSGSAYIIAQTVTDAAGGEITTIDRDSRFNPQDFFRLAITLLDKNKKLGYISEDKTIQDYL